MLQDLQANFTNWLRRTLGAPQASVRAITPLAGGLSSETHLVTVDGLPEGSPWPAELVLRWDPGEGLLAPYDMELQYRVYAALAASPVPVPRVFFLELDASAIGRPFYVMERVRGVAPGRLLDPTDCERYARQHNSYVSTLAAIHRVDWAAIGLGFLGAEPPGELAMRRIDVLEQFIRRVQWQPEPDLDEAVAWLRGHKPACSRVGLVHGDCSLSNYLFHEDRVVGVLDWELCALSDPLEDVGFFCGLIPMYRTEASAVDHQRERDQFLDAYGALTGEDFRELPFWDVFFSLRGTSIVLSGRRLARLRGEDPLPGATDVYRERLRSLIS
ncbi:MAG: phosphotransferase family protein [Dehalococcoidia bacterium]|nr:phosphotransferase family protein [Dehalococcoidia bacterium]